MSLSMSEVAAAIVVGTRNTESIQTISSINLELAIDRHGVGMYFCKRAERSDIQNFSYG